MTSSFYPASLKEYQGYDYYESPAGYFTYKMVDANRFHLHHFYVTPLCRKTKGSLNLWNKMESMARELNATYITSFVYFANQNKEDSITNTIKMGMKIVDWDSEKITFGKEL